VNGYFYGNYVDSVERGRQQVPEDRVRQ